MDLRIGLPITLSTIMSAAAAGSPTMVLDFKNAQSLISSVGGYTATHSRAGHAAMIDATGKFTYPPNNLATYSDDITQAIYIKSGADTPTANTLRETNASASHHMYYQIAVTAQSRYTVQHKVQANGRSAIYVSVSYGAATEWVSRTFDLATGTAGATQVGAGAGPTIVNATIAATGVTGEYLVSVTFDAVPSTTYVIFGLSDVATPTIGSFGFYVYAGDGVQSVYISNIQIERVGYETTPRTFKATTGSAYYGPRFNFDPVTLRCRGLLSEGARTNLMLWTSPRTIADFPSRSGLVTFSTSVDFNIFTRNAFAFGYDGATLSLAYQTLATSVQAYTVSVYVKMDDGGAPAFGSSTTSNASNDFGLVLSTNPINPTTYTVKHVGGGVYRVSGTATASGSGSCGVVKYASNSSRTFKFTAAQCEAGGAASTLIDTGAAAVTRPAETVSMSGSNFAPWYNATNGTFVHKGSLDSGANAAVQSWMLVVSDGTFNNYMATYTPSSEITGLRVRTASADVVITAANVALTVAQYRVAFRYKENDFAVAINSGDLQTDTSGGVPTVDRMHIGSLVGTSQSFGHIEYVAFYPTPTPDAGLIGRSA